jgi:hypothetical protein
VTSGAAERNGSCGSVPPTDAEPRFHPRPAPGATFLSAAAFMQ